MKKNGCIFGLLLFLFCLSNVCLNPFLFQKNNQAGAFFNDISNYNYTFLYENQTFQFESQNLLKNIELTTLQKEYFKKYKNRSEILNQLNNFGLNETEKINYVFPEIKIMLGNLSKKIEETPTNPDIEVYLNTCSINYKPGANGRFIDLPSFYNDLKKQIENNEKNIKIQIKTKNYKIEDNLKRDFVEKSQFSTSFKTSLPERKNNIKNALSCFDGLVLNEGETLSFNQITGKRTEENGYKQAKIISGGTFVSGFGGGVCQVSTTLYNACVLAGLEIVEVHQHSLPVSYIEPSFDAMVNTGSSDLVIKNNTGGKLIFTTSNIGDECKVKIFGKKNQYKIKRKSEKIKVIPSQGDTFETDAKKFNIENLAFGEEMRITYPKDGYQSVGYLEYYDNSGKLLKTKKIRSDTYAPVKGVILKNG